MFCFSFGAFADKLYISSPTIIRLNNVKMVYKIDDDITVIRYSLLNNTYVITNSGILVCKYRDTIYISSNYYITD